MRGIDYYYVYLFDEVFENWKEEGIVFKDYIFKD